MGQASVVDVGILYVQYALTASCALLLSMGQLIIIAVKVLIYLLMEYFGWFCMRFGGFLTVFGLQVHCV